MNPLIQLKQTAAVRNMSNHVFYISQFDSHVRELYYNGKWWGNDLTAATNGPQAVGLTSFFGGSVAHVFYVSYPDAHVRELYYANGKWWENDLTAATNGPRAGWPPNSLFDGSVAHVFYTDDPNHVRELYYANGKWWGNDLTAATNAPQAQPQLTSFFDGSVEHVFYVSGPGGQFDAHVRELYYNGKWWGNDLTTATNGPFAQSDSLTSFFDGSVAHVFYVSQTLPPDLHVRELYYNGKWWGNDLTAATNGPQAVSQGLTSFFDGSVAHVFYVSYPDWHVRELYYNGKWWGNDLTAATNGPLAGHIAQVGTLTSFFDGSVAHVFYVSYPDAHVRELYYANGKWWGNDLTAATNGPIADSYPLTSFCVP